VFRCFLILQVAGFLCLLTATLLVLRFPAAVSWYEWINIADLAAGELVTLGVIYELIDELALSRLSLRHAVRSLTRWTLGVLLLVAAVTSALLQNGGLRSTWKVFQMVDFSGNLIKLGLLLALLFFTRALRISWRSLPAGIALGFGVYASVELSAATLFSVFGHGKNLVLLDAVRMAAFHVCVVIWLVYILLPEKQPGFTGHRPDRTDLESWDQELQKWCGEDSPSEPPTFAGHRPNRIHFHRFHKRGSLPQTMAGGR
jgi:hypothetical protein